MEDPKEKEKSEETTSEKIEERAIAAARLIYHSYKDYASKRKAKQKVDKIGRIDETNNEMIKVPKHKMEEKEVKTGTAGLLKSVPLDSLAKVVQFLCTPLDFYNIMRVSRQFKKVTQYYEVWNTFLEINSPKLVEWVVAKNSLEDASKVNLKALFVQTIAAVHDQIRTWTEELEKIKADGNESYKQEKYMESIDKYAKAKDAATEVKRNLEDNPFFNKFKTEQETLDLFKVLAIINSNAAQANMNITNWGDAYVSAKRACKHIAYLRDNVSREIFEKDLDLLNQKIQHRLTLSRGHVIPLTRFFRYSEVPVREIKVGSMLTASTNISSGIFHNSKVFIYEFTRGQVKCVSLT